CEQLGAQLRGQSVAVVRRVQRDRRDAACDAEVHQLRRHRSTLASTVGSVGCDSPDVDVIADLAAEQERLEALLAQLDEAAWSAPSGAPGWTISDVVLHLAQTEEAVAATIHESARPGMWDRGDTALDDAVAQAVAAERDEPARVFARWQAARRSALAALRDA